MALCQEKRRYGNRLEAESALAIAHAAWRRDTSRSPSPPVRVYRCAGCDGWHLTHKPVRRGLVVE